ncbi:MAG: thiamine pyrophosphate-binding protein [Methanopyri archaeon]|nr:thiamine pyrophosphate-binding protein [Methanopyri archaeon]
MKASGYRMRPVFSVPGGDVIGPYTDFHREGNLVRTVRDDTAALAAQGAAEATVEPASVLVTGGPGLGAALHGIASAAADRVPVLVMTGSVDETGFQALKPSITSDGVKPRVTEDPEEAAVDLVRCRPVVFETSGSDDLDTVVEAVEESPGEGPDPKSMSDVLDLVEGSRTVFLIGGGCRWAGVSEILEELSKNLGVPMVESLRGRGVVPEHSPFNHGMIGVRGWADGLLEEADVVVALGARLTERTVANIPDDVSLVHVGYERPLTDVDVSITCDLVEFLKAFEDADPDPWEPEKPEGPPELDTVTFDIVKAARKAWIGPTVVDSGQVTATAILAGEVSTPWELVVPSRYCPVGFSLPAALGVASRVPEPVLAIMGDHAFLYSLSEWVTVAEEELPVVGLVVRNGEMGFVRQFQEAEVGEVRGVDVDCDVEGFLERDLGIEVVELEADGDEVYRTLRELEMKKEPKVVFVDVPREDLPLP